MSPAPKKALDLSTYSGRFAARLHALRVEAGLTVEQMVEAVVAQGFDLTAKSVYNWEGGLRQPPLDAYPHLAQALGLKSVRTLMPER
jgi:transcriptional regulator with XRE-family HTH domain